MACAPAFQYNDADFRAQYPAFSDQVAYPTSALQQYFNTAGLFVANSNYGWLAAAGATLTALYLLTAHLAQLATKLANGETPAVMSGAGIDKINVTLEPPPAKNLWQWWLSTTGYGAQLLALLLAQSVGGFFVPGSIGRQGFGPGYGNTGGIW